MITYSKTAWGLHLLYRLYGSALLRCSPFAILSGIMTTLLYVFWKQEDDDSWRHPYVYSLSASVVGFVVVFRSNFGYQRYWEGRTHLQEMTGRWADAYTQAVVFHSGREGSSSERTIEFRETLLHLMSLVHALAVQHLRGDWDLHNLQPSHPTDLPPPVDAAALQYLIGPPSRKDGTWRFPIVDLFVLRGTDEKRIRYNRAMPLGVIGGVTSEEVQLLGGGMHIYGESSMETVINGIDLHPDSCCAAFFGLSTGTYIPGAAERVNMVYSWVLQLLRQRGMEGELVMPTPIAANLFHMLSEGLIAFENARKLADTPFPFPWAQAVLALLIIFAFTAPLLIVAYVDRLWLAIVLDVMTVQSYWALNEVARDLEDPFVFEPNDLPLARIQYQFNERIKAASSTQRPAFYCKGSVYMSDKTEEDGCSHSRRLLPKQRQDAVYSPHPSANLAAKSPVHTMNTNGDC